MSNYLCIRITEEKLSPWTPLAWSLVDIDSQIVSSGVSLLNNLMAEVEGFDASTRSVIIVPGELVLTKTVALPKAQQSHIKQVLPFIVEDFLIDPIESMHLAAAPLLAKEEVSVACVKRGHMYHWLDAFDEAGLQPDCKCTGTGSPPEPWHHRRGWHVRRDRMTSARYVSQTNAKKEQPQKRDCTRLLDCLLKTRYSAY